VGSDSTLRPEVAFDVVACRGIVALGAGCWGAMLVGGKLELAAVTFGIDARDGVVAPEGVRAGALDCGAVGVRVGATAGFAASGAPHMPQNRFPSLFSLPQRPQRTRPLLLSLLA